MFETKNERDQFKKTTQRFTFLFTAICLSGSIFILLVANRTIKISDSIVDIVGAAAIVCFIFGMFFCIALCAMHVSERHHKQYEIRRERD